MRALLFCFVLLVALLFFSAAYTNRCIAVLVVVVSVVWCFCFMGNIKLVFDCCCWCYFDFLLNLNCLQFHLKS